VPERERGSKERFVWRGASAKLASEREGIEKWGRERRKERDSPEEKEKGGELG
jgi:hypothetical protein